MNRIIINKSTGLMEHIDPIYYNNGMTHWYKIESSNLVAMMHNRDQNILFVEFDGGAVYRYINVSEKLFTNLLNAESRGHEFYVLIKRHVDRYPYHKAGTIDDYLQYYEYDGQVLSRGMYKSDQ